MMPQKAPSSHVSVHGERENRPRERRSGQPLRTAVAPKLDPKGKHQWANARWKYQARGLHRYERK